MKKILFLPLLIAMMACKAQQPVEINQPYNFHKYISVGKYTTANKPAASACPRCIIFNTDSSNFAFSNGSGWIYYGGGGGNVTVNWGQIGGGNPRVQTDLNNLLNQKVNYTDTGNMLSPYLRAVLGVKYADTGIMLSPYLRAALGVKYTDTGTMLAPYLRTVNFTKAGIGLSHVVDSIQVFNAGGMTSLQKGTFAAIPAAASGPTMYFATDTLAWYYNDGSSYHKMAGGTGGGGGAFYDSTLMLSTFSAKSTYLRIDSFSSGGIARILGYVPYSSLNPAGFITGNQTVTFTAHTGSDIVVSGSNSGSTSLDPTLLIGNGAVTYNKMQTNVAKSIIGNSQNSTTVNRAIFPKAGFIWDTDSLKADTTYLASINKLAGYLPLTWTSNPVISGNGDTLKINGGYINLLSGAGNGNFTIGNGAISIKGVSTFPSNNFIISSQFNDPAISFQYYNGTNNNEPIRLNHDTVFFFGKNSAAGLQSYIASSGNVFFQGHVIGVTESTSDSSDRLASTKLLKQLLANFTPGGSQVLTLGSGLLGGSYNGTSAVTAKVDSSLYSTHNYVAANFMKPGDDSAAMPGLWITKAIVGKVRTFSADSAGMATYFLRRKDSISYVTPTALATGLATKGTVNSITAGLYMTGGAITTAGTIGADSAAMAGYFMRRKDTTNQITGYATLYQLGLKGSGTVKSVATGFGLTGGPITNTGTVAWDSTMGGTVSPFHGMAFNDTRYHRSFLDSMYFGLIKDTLQVKHLATATVAFLYADSATNSIFDKGFKNTGNVHMITDVDSVNYATVDLTGQPANNISSGTFAAARYGNGTIPAIALSASSYTGSASTILAGNNTWIGLPTGVTNLSHTRYANFDSLFSSTGTPIRLDTANDTQAGLMSVYLRNVLNHSYKFKNDTTTGGDTTAYAVIDTLLFKRFKVFPGLVAFHGQSFFGAGVDSNWIKALVGWGGSPFYQTVLGNASAVTQRTKLNFGSQFTVADNSGTTSTDVTINTLNQNTTGTAGGLSAVSALPDGTTATKQAPKSNDAKVATDNYVNDAITASQEPLALLMSTSSISNTTTEYHFLSGGNSGSASVTYQNVGGGIPSGFTGQAVFKIRMGGIYSTTTVPGNLTIRFYFGSTVVATATLSGLAATGSGLGWVYNGTLTVRSVNAGTATCALEGSFDYATTAGTTPKISTELNNAGSTFTVSTASGNAIDLTGQWATANASNTISATTFIIERIF